MVCSQKNSKYSTPQLLNQIKGKNSFQKWNEEREKVCDGYQGVTVLELYPCGRMWRRISGPSSDKLSKNSRKTK